VAKKRSAVPHITRDYSRRIHRSSFGTQISIDRHNYFYLYGNRQAGQGGDADTEVRDLRAELLKAEAAHFAKKNGKTLDGNEEEASSSAAPKRTIEDANSDVVEEDEDSEAKRRRLILEEARELDADSDGSSEEDSDEEYGYLRLMFATHQELMTTAVRMTKRTRRPSLCARWRRSRERELNNAPKRYFWHLTAGAWLH
jgi:hypothetical protein